MGIKRILRISCMCICLIISSFLTSEAFAGKPFMERYDSMRSVHELAEALRTGRGFNTGAREMFVTALSLETGLEFSGPSAVADFLESDQVRVEACRDDMLIGGVYSVVDSENSRVIEREHCGENKRVITYQGRAIVLPRCGNPVVWLLEERSHVRRQETCIPYTETYATTTGTWVGEFLGGSVGRSSTVRGTVSYCK